MDQWLGLGIFLLGSGIGALLTRIAQQGMKSEGTSMKARVLSEGEGMIAEGYVRAPTTDI
jgi:hypothetical protein